MADGTRFKTLEEAVRQLQQSVSENQAESRPFRASTQKLVEEIKKHQQEAHDPFVLIAATMESTLVQLLVLGALPVDRNVTRPETGIPMAPSSRGEERPSLLGAGRSADRIRDPEVVRSSLPSIQESSERSSFSRNPVLLQKALDSPDPEVVEDSLSLLVSIKAINKTPRGRYEPTCYGRLPSGFSLSFDASVLIVKFGDLGMLREGIWLDILMDTLPQPIVCPFGQDDLFRVYTSRYYADQDVTSALTGRKEVLSMSNLCAYQFWQWVFKDKFKFRVEQLKELIHINEVMTNAAFTESNLVQPSLNQISEACMVPHTISLLRWWPLQIRFQNSEYLSGDRQENVVLPVCPFFESNEEYDNRSGTSQLAFMKDGNIFVISDTRGSSEDVDDVSDAIDKFMRFDEILPHIVATKAGPLDFCKKLENFIHANVQQQGVLQFDELTQIAFDYLHRESMSQGHPKEKRICFGRVSSIFTTLDPVEGPRIALVSAQNEGPEPIQQGVCVERGSGGSFAKAAFLFRGDYENINDDDCLIRAQLAIAYAAYKDPHTGGKVRAFHIREDGREHYETDIIRVFLENYHEFMEIEHALYIQRSGNLGVEAEEYRNASLFVLRHAHAKLTQIDVELFFREELDADARSWNSLGTLATGFNLTLITIKGNPRTATRIANEIYSSARDIKPRYRPAHTYKLPAHKCKGGYIFVGRSFDANLRAMILGDLQ